LELERVAKQLQQLETENIELKEHAEQTAFERDQAGMQFKLAQSELQTSAKSYKDAISNFEQLLQVKNASLVQLEEDVATLRKQVGTAEARAEKETKELKEALYEQERKHQCEQQTVQHELSSLAQEAAAEKQRLSKECEGQVRRLEQSLLLANNELRNRDALRREETERFKAEIRRHEEEVAEVEQRLELEKRKNEEERHELEKQVSLSNVKRDGQTEEAKYYKRKLDEKSKEVDALKDRLHDVTSREQKAQKQLGDLKAAHESELASLKRTLPAENDQPVRELEEQVESLSQEVKRSRDEAARLRQALEQKEAEIANLQRLSCATKRGDEAENKRRPDLTKDSLDALREDFNKNMNLMEESIARQSLNRVSESNNWVGARSRSAGK
jgi:hypothetical protein